MLEIHENFFFLSFFFFKWVLLKKKKKQQSIKCLVSGVALLLVNNNVAGMALLLDTCKASLGLHSKTATASWREASVDRKLLVVELHPTWLKFHLDMNTLVAASRSGSHLQSEKSQSASCKWGCQECHKPSVLRTLLVCGKSSFP